MANIRSLLGKEFASTVSGLGNATPPIHDGKVFIFMDQHRSCRCECQGHNCIQRWCVPCGVTHMTFEVWGGGGGGGGACCCMMGVPGTTGAYARKTLTKENGDFDYNDCYSMCVGTATETSNSFRGNRGCKTYITGPGLSNFCAEGGWGGLTCCGILSNSNCLNVNCISFCSGSETDCLGYGPSAYGGDENIQGRAGWIRFHCQENCAVKVMIPYPAKLIDDQGGWYEGHYCTRCMCGTELNCNISMPWQNMGTLCQNHGMPGFGGASAITCSSTCTCGSVGSGGLIRITYCSCHMGDRDLAVHMCN